MAGERWITVDRAAQISGYRPDSIRVLARSGRVAGRKVSTVWLVDSHSLSAYVKRARLKGAKRGRKPQKPSA